MKYPKCQEYIYILSLVHHFTARLSSRLTRLRIILRFRWGRLICLKFPSSANQQGHVNHFSAAIFISRSPLCPRKCKYGRSQESSGTAAREGSIKTWCVRYESFQFLFSQNSTNVYCVWILNDKLGNDKVLVYSSVPFSLHSNSQRYIDSPFVGWEQDQGYSPSNCWLTVHGEGDVSSIAEHLNQTCCDNAANGSRHKATFKTKGFNRTFKWSNYKSERRDKVGAGRKSKDAKL